jgi:multiple sugar transport system substrate-binding protein
MSPTPAPAFVLRGLPSPIFPLWAMTDRSAPLLAAPASPSARSAHREAAIDFAAWITGAAVQSGPYAAAGGQPGHAAAWESHAVNAPVDGFYAKTRATLDGAWVRPRHEGYMTFQERGSERLIAGLKAREAAKPVIADLNALFAASFT